MQRNRLSAFTLVELLVVIGIISVLAGIIFPVLAAGRASARQTACSSNLRQLGMAAKMYAADFDGVANLPDIFDPVVPAYVKSPEILVCPNEFTKQGIAVAILPHAGRRTKYRRSYAYIGNLVWDDPAIKQEMFPKLAEFACVLHGSSTYIESSIWNEDGTAELSPAEWAPMYDGKRLRVMQDGHIKVDHWKITRGDHISSFSELVILNDLRPE